ncbi:MAG: hypothetical protein IT425_08315, partial [Pirellulales bacterium]|nr:hypothetical protein [Pirellulales bacterium]
MYQIGWSSRAGILPGLSGRIATSTAFLLALSVGDRLAAAELLQPAEYVLAAGVEDPVVLPSPTEALAPVQAPALGQPALGSPKPQRLDLIAEAKAEAEGKAEAASKAEMEAKSEADAQADPQAPDCPEKKPAKKPPANPCAAAYKPVFYDNDFKYLNDPNYHGCCFGDGWKQMPVGNCGECGTLDIGGQARLRYHHEIGMGQDLAGDGTRRFEDTEHDFLLSRVRLYTNWKIDDCTRFYVEGIYADVTDDDGTYLPRSIDRNFGDFLNAFVDYSPAEGTTLRVGRQEL